jgi:hypothetical protein
MSDERIRVIRAKLSDEQWRTLKATAAVRGLTLQEYATELLGVEARDGKARLVSPPDGPDWKVRAGEVTPATSVKKKPSLADTWRR